MNEFAKFVFYVCPIWQKYIMVYGKDWFTNVIKCCQSELVLYLSRLGVVIAHSIIVRVSTVSWQAFKYIRSTQIGAYLRPLSILRSRSSSASILISSLKQNKSKDSIKSNKYKIWKEYFTQFRQWWYKTLNKKQIT